MGTETMSITKRVSAVLQAAGEESLTMGQILDRAEIPKTSAPEVSSALNKLRNAGRVKTVRGPSSSKNGPGYVRRYLWAQKPVKPASGAVRAASPLQMLGIGRIA